MFIDHTAIGQNFKGFGFQRAYYATNFSKPQLVFLPHKYTVCSPNEVRPCSDADPLRVGTPRASEIFGSSQRQAPQRSSSFSQCFTRNTDDEPPSATN